MDVEFYRMRIIYKESIYEISWISMLPRTKDHIMKVMDDYVNT